MPPAAQSWDAEGKSRESETFWQPKQHQLKTELHFQQQVEEELIFDASLGKERTKTEVKAEDLRD